MIGLEKSFWMIYSNTHLRTRETLPLIGQREHSCSHLQQVRAHLKGTVSWKLRHRLLTIIRKLSLQGSDGTRQNFKNIKPLPRNLRIKYTAFTRYFTFKGPASAQVFGIPCVQNTWNPFAWVKSRARQPKTNTFKVKCPHLNFAQIFACKTPLKVRNIHWNMTTWLFLSTFHFESVLHGPIYAQSKWEHSTVKVFCIPMPNLGQMQVLWTWNIR